MCFVSGDGEKERTMKLRNIGLPLVVLVASIAVGEECSDGMCKLSSDKKGSTSLDAVPSVNIMSIAQGLRLQIRGDSLRWVLSGALPIAGGG